MDSSKAINRYRNLVTVCILLIGALGLTLYEVKVEQHQQQSLKNTLQQTISPPTEALFKVDETYYSLDMLTPDLQSSLYQIRKQSFEQQRRVLEQAIIATHLSNQTANQIAHSDDQAQVPALNEAAKKALLDRLLVSGEAQLLLKAPMPATAIQ